MPTEPQPQQREAVRRMRKALAQIPEPERRMILAALQELWQDGGGLRCSLTSNATALEYALLLAQEERLGHQPEEGEPVQPSDESRALEILALYPKTGGE